MTAVGVLGLALGLVWWATERRVGREPQPGDAGADGAAGLVPIGPHLEGTSGPQAGPPFAPPAHPDPFPRGGDAPDGTLTFVPHEPTGTLFLAGSVVDEAGRGIEGADVWIDLRVEMGSGAWGARWRFREAKCDPAGRFRFTDLPVGHYDLHAVAPGREHGSTDRELSGDATDLLLTLRPAGDVTFQVVPPQGWPKSVRSLWLDPASPTERMLEKSEGGPFVARGVSAGDHLLWLRDTTIPDWEKGESMAVRTERRFQVHIGPETREVTLRFAPDEEVGLRVTIPEGVAGTGVEAAVVEGPGGAGSQIELHVERAADGTVRTTRPPSPGALWPPVRETTRDGLPLVPGLPKGRSRVRVTAVGFETVERDLDVVGPTTLEVTLTLAAGTVFTASVTSPPAYWRVEVRKAGGDGEWRTLLWQDARRVITHRSTPGVFRALLSPGTYDVRGISSDHVPASWGTLAVGERSETRAFPLIWSGPSGPSIVGHLRSAAGKPLPDPLLRVFRVPSPAGGLEAMPEKETKVHDGVFRIRGLLPGRYRLSRMRSGEPALAEVDVAYDDVPLEITLLD